MGFKGESTTWAIHLMNTLVKNKDKLIINSIDHHKLSKNYQNSCSLNDLLPLMLFDIVVYQQLFGFNEIVQKKLMEIKNRNFNFYKFFVIIKED